MKNLLRFAFILSAFLNPTNLFSQNVVINVLTQNAGIVKKGELSFFEVTIINTSSVKSLPTYKIRPQIMFPDELVSIPDTGHVLPEGWVISSNKNGVVMLSNGTDNVPGYGSRTILIAFRGKSIGGPKTITGNILFSNGTTPGTESGPPTKEDNIADNFSSSSIEVFK
jgi:hypothetical protein